MSNTLTKLSLVMGVLGLGFSSVAKADMKWVETLRGYCPTVCQEKAADKYNKENAAYKFAVPGGINPRATKARGSESVYYICATHYSGWRIGYNIDYQRDRCYTGFRGSEHYGEVYLCLCTDKEMPPLPTDDTGYIKRR
ncbi:MAG: hypothetical protein VSS75_008405 [Candidatus Parabeggiatoa sp.]|nr:hypothetical protein [Candidatus Parabeggiatoa sp.]